MNDPQPCSYESKSKSEYEEIRGTSKDETDEACFKDAVGILKEQNGLSDSSCINNYSNLYCSKNYANNDYISSKKDKEVAGLNDIRKVCVELSNGVKNEENSILTKETLQDLKENNEINSQKSSDRASTFKNIHSKEINGFYKAAVNMSDSNETVYYAVHIPSDNVIAEAVVDKEVDSPLVYTDKEEVLKVIKSNKKARFKQFKTIKEAEEFALNGAEIIVQEGSSAVTDNEKVMPFKRPKTEEMIQFRKDIERGDIEAVREKIFENPKYLVSNGDTPSILQEGPRYNALHVSAKSKNAKITQLILDSITRIDFISYLYDDNDIDSCVSRSEILLDRYLNTPDKGFNETPLHLAVKHGAIEVVQVLLSYSQCQKYDIYNRYNELPKDIICSRVFGPCEETKAAIASMLDEQFFVPVLRSEDNSLQPRVGEAFSLESPLKLQCDLLSPRLEIQAYAGPMSKEKAEIFKKKWKTPTRSVRDLNSSLSSRLRDAEKGLEKTGRNLAAELQVPWQEYWSFLDTFVDISSPQGLQLLENYLKNRFQETFDSLKREKSGNVSLDSNEKSFSLIQDLCETFELCGPQEKLTPNSPPRPKSVSKLKTFQTSFSATPSFLQRESCPKKINESFKNYGKNPLVYVERSCEVFGKRIGAAISSCVLYENHAESFKESLETQVKHLLSLIKSYKEDNRFQSVDFQLIHSRVAAVAIQSLKVLTNRDKQLILTALKEIDWSDGALSDDEDLNYNYRNFNNEWLGIITKQLHCLVKRLITQLNEFQDNTPQISPSARDEADCQTLWALTTPCACTWGGSMSKRTRGALKRKQLRNEGECDCETLPRKIQFEEEKEEFFESSNLLFVADEESDDNFSTPPSGNSDTEDMEDVKETPNTFIYPGSKPTKTDFAVLEAIDKVPLSAEKYPNIYLWRHILQTQPKSTLTENRTSPESLHRKPIYFSSPVSSPRKLLDKSFGSCESPSMHSFTVEPWERVIGPYSPRKSRSNSSVLLCESPLR